MLLGAQSAYSTVYQGLTSYELAALVRLLEQIDTGAITINHASDFESRARLGAVHKVLAMLLKANKP
jgi:hypothetical protein